MRDIPHKVTGSDYTAVEYEEGSQLELENFVKSTGISLSASDLYQLAKTVANMVAAGDFYVDSGSGNAYVLAAPSPRQAPTHYVDGFKARFRISHTNTGAATVNVNGLGLKAIVKGDGVTPLGAGDLPINEHGEIIYHANHDNFELYSHKYQDSTFSTGQVVGEFAEYDKTGWVRLGQTDMHIAQTIGSATSGADVRANADCENLFKYLWYNVLDTHCPVIGGRGGSAEADWIANKKITLPWFNGMTIAAVRSGIDESASVEGLREEVIALAQMPSHSHGINDPGHAHTYIDPNGAGTQGTVQASFLGPGITGSSVTNISIQAAGGATPFNKMQPTIKLIFYQKL